MIRAILPRPLAEEVHARAQVVGATLAALTDDTNADVTRVLGLAARWDGAVIDFELAGLAQAIERLGANLHADESVAWHATRSALVPSAFDSDSTPAVSVVLSIAMIVLRVQNG
jgi:hypothetical protein